MSQDKIKNLTAQSPGHARIGLFICLVALAFATGLSLGTALDIRGRILSRAKPVDIAKIINLYSRSRSGVVSFDQFWSVWDMVKQKHVNQPVDDKNLFYGAMEGLVRGLNDPHSAYFPPKEADEFARDLSGELEGIGAEIGIKNNVITVIAPLAGSPAERAGLHPGDKIFAINKQDTHDMSLSQAVAKIRGPKGTKVTLTVLSRRSEEVKDFTITREKINVPTVISEMKSDHIAYIHITYFNADTGAEFDRTVRQLLLQEPKGVILDLRSDPGGFLEMAIDVASEWITDGVIVSERFKDGAPREHLTRGAHRLFGLPTVVLVDEGSASGSEIVAGALQDYGVATIIGAKTYGKGSVQDFQILPDGSALKLTIAKWYTPKNRQIDKEGITPDIILEKMVEKKVGPGEKDAITLVDLGLKRALEILQNKK